jgi:hypothetical protein
MVGVAAVVRARPELTLRDAAVSRAPPLSLSPLPAFAGRGQSRVGDAYGCGSGDVVSPLPA